VLVYGIVLLCRNKNKKHRTAQTICKITECRVCWSWCKQRPDRYYSITIIYSIGRIEWHAPYIRNYTGNLVVQSSDLNIAQPANYTHWYMRRSLPSSMLCWQIFRSDADLQVNLNPNTIDHEQEKVKVTITTCITAS
jgi:hypothetical protein